MKKVYSIVLNNFRNDSRVLKEAVSLQTHGYDVTVMALHDGSVDLLEYESVLGIHVHRVRLLTKSWSKSFVVQLIKYMEFFIRLLVECWGADIVHCNDLEPLPIGVALKWLSLGRIKIVYDAHEFETERARINSSWQKSLMRVVEAGCLHFSDAIMTVGEGIAIEYAKRYGISTIPCVVMNAPIYTPVKDKENLFRRELGIGQEKRIFLYQGGLIKGRGIKLLLQTFKIKKDQLKQCVLIFMGYGELESWIEQEIANCDNIFLHFAVAPQELLSYTRSADYGLVVIEPICLSYYYCLPNKLFEYAAAGLPMILNDLFELRKMTEVYKMGVLVEHMTVEDVVIRINEIMAMDYQVLSDNACRLAAENSWEIQEKRLLEQYKKL